MEDMNQYLNALQNSLVIGNKIISTLKEDKENINRGLSGEPETVYKKQCDQVIEEIEKIQKKVKILYSESSAG